MARPKTIVLHPKLKRSTRNGQWPNVTPTSQAVSNTLGQVRYARGTTGVIARDLPPSGPSNIIVRTPSPLPAPRDVGSQK